MTSPALDVKTFAQAAADLKGVLDAASSTGRPVIIAREDGEPVVVVPLSVWNARAEEEAAADEAAYARLRESIAQAERGEFVEAEWNGERYAPVAAE